MPNHVKTPERSFQFRKPLNICVTVANQFTVKLPTAIVRPQPRVPLTKSVKEPGPSRPVTVTVPLVLPTETSEPERSAPAFATASAMLRIDQQGNQQVRLTSPEGTTTLKYPRSFTTINPEHITKTTIHRFTTPSTHISYQGLRQAQPSHQMLRHTHTIIRVPADQQTIQNNAPNGPSRWQVRQHRDVRTPLRSDSQINEEAHASLDRQRWQRPRQS
jgi:hypothetical protein